MRIRIVIFFAVLFSYVSSNAQYNTATGTGALFSVTTGGANTATGYLSLTNLTTAWNNSAHGAYSLLNNIIGSTNAAYGTNALRNNYNGNENTSHGFKSLYNNIGGSWNTASGTESLYSVGSNFNTGIGFRSLYSTSTGQYNVGVGFYGGSTNTAGNNNTYIGYGTDNYSSSSWETQYSNTTVIGANTHRSAYDTSNKITVGDNATIIGGIVNWTVYSDKRIKRNVAENVPGLNLIKLLRPVTYSYDIPRLNSFLHGVIQNDTNLAMRSEIKNKADEEYGKVVRTGFLAQEVDRAVSSINFSFNGVHKPKSSQGLYSLNYEQFVVPLVKSIQEINSTNEQLRSEADNLISQLKSILRELDVLNTIQLKCCGK